MGYDRSTKGLHRYIFISPEFDLHGSPLSKVDSSIFESVSLPTPEMQPRALLLGHFAGISLDTYISKTIQDNVIKLYCHKCIRQGSINCSLRIFYESFL